MVCNVPVSKNVCPVSGKIAPAVAVPSFQFTPLALSCSTTSRLCAWSKKVRILCATVGPTSLTCKSWSMVASMMASKVPKWRDNSFAVASPTWRIPSPNKNLGKVVLLDFSIPANTLAADFSAILSNWLNADSPSLYKSGKVLTMPASTNCSTSLSPSSSISTARLWAKCKIACLRCALQNRPPVHR